MPDTPPVRRGVFITAGMRLAITGISLSIANDGSVSSTGSVQVSMDLSPYWLAIAIDHGIEADQRHDETLAALASSEDQRLSVALEREFSASMQSVVAAAIALDAFYEALLEYVPIPQTTREAWSRTKTKRYKRIGEIFRQAFRLGPRSAVGVRNTIREMFNLRDRAVHPPSDLSAPLPHQDMPTLAVEWRFVAFRAETARNATGNALRLVTQLATRPAEIPGLREYCEGVQSRVRPLVERWEQRFGALVPPTS